MVDSHFCIKLIDFGESRVLTGAAKLSLEEDTVGDPDSKTNTFWKKDQNKCQRTYAGTLEFMAPEIFMNQAYG